VRVVLEMDGDAPGAGFGRVKRTQESAAPGWRRAAAL
jgi:hypothetical protein